jgi:hypothetical protein
LRRRRKVAFNIKMSRGQKYAKNELDYIDKKILNILMLEAKNL